MAEALEALYQDSLDEYLEQLAYHYDQAGAAEQAVTYLLKAGQKAARSYLNDQAAEPFRRGLALLEGAALAGAPPSWRQDVGGQLYEGLSDVLALTGQYEAVREALESAVPLVPAASVRRARLHRKMAQTWELQREYRLALGVYRQAETALGRAPDSEAPAAPAWWREWVQLQVSQGQAHYFLGEVEEMAALADRVRPAIERHGTALQRGLFYRALTQLGSGRERFVLSAATVGYAEAAAAAFAESDNLAELTAAEFTVGFAYLWYGWAVHLSEYVAMADANAAWLAGRVGDVVETRRRGAVALEASPAAQEAIFPWLFHGPLMGAAHAAGRVAEAVEHARAMVAPDAQPLPDALARAIQVAVDAAERSDLPAAGIHLKGALELARELGIL